MVQPFTETVKYWNEIELSLKKLFRSREFSGQQTSNVFSGSFMSSQFQMESNPNPDQHGYDLAGHAHLVAGLQVHIKFKLNQEDKNLNLFLSFNHYVHD
jgi:hypothetical protein